jgi:nucleobindin
MQDDIEHQKKADRVAGSILNIMDKNKDGKISLEEFEEVGVKGLPSFEHEGAEGHHYDVESGRYPSLPSLSLISNLYPSIPEFFLHHEGH